MPNARFQCVMYGTLVADAHQALQLHATLTMAPYRLPALASNRPIFRKVWDLCSPGNTRASLAELFHPISGCLHCFVWSFSQKVMLDAGGSQGSPDPGSAADTWLLVLHPRLTTTRSLERFRNQVRSISRQIIDSGSGPWPTSMAFQSPE